MKTSLLIFASVILIVLAAGLTFLNLHRYGIHSDSTSCSENQSQETFYTASSYLVMTQTYPENNVHIGTCPYENFKATTYALDLWIPTAVLSFISYKRINHQNREAK